MPQREAKQEWILLIHQLPPVPTNLRVRIWRKLQKLGSISIKNSIYVLPFNEKTHEDFQWLKQEIDTAGGEATVFRASLVEGATDEDIIAAFRKERDEEYARVAAALESLTAVIRSEKRDGHLSAGRLASHEAELDRLHAELERIVSTDFFDARGRAVALASYERCRKALSISQSHDKTSKGARAAKGEALDRSQYQGRRWVTRRNLHIDRLASAWLIKQFIDKRPRFYFVVEGETVEGGIPFDILGAEFTHRGEDCTFETLIKRFDLGGDSALREMAEIVHDIDLKDDKFHRLEAAGLNSVVRGLSLLLRNDRTLLRQSSALFDGLYALLSKNSSEKKVKRKSGRKQTSGRAKKKAKSKT